MLDQFIGKHIKKVVYHPYRTARISPIKFSIRDEELANTLQGMLYKWVGGQCDNHCVYEVFWEAHPGSYPPISDRVVISINDGVLSFGQKLKQFERGKHCGLRGELYTAPIVSLQVKGLRLDLGRELAHKLWKKEQA